MLKQRASEITDIDSSLALLVDGMVEAMNEVHGVGLAAPQVGVQKRLFVYDIGEGPITIINPTIAESDGEWEYEEGCLSVPGLYFPIVRPKQVHLMGLDLDGNDVSIEADELLARAFLHEVDHLDGVLLLDRLDPAQRKQAMRELRRQSVENERPPHDVGL